MGGLSAGLGALPGSVSSENAGGGGSRLFAYAPPTPPRTTSSAGPLAEAPVAQSTPDGEGTQPPAPPRSPAANQASRQAPPQRNQTSSTGTAQEDPLTTAGQASPARSMQQVVQAVDALPDLMSNASPVRPRTSQADPREARPDEGEQPSTQRVDMNPQSRDSSGGRGGQQQGEAATGSRTSESAPGAEGPQAGLQTPAAARAGGQALNNISLEQVVNQRLGVPGTANRALPPDTPVVSVVETLLNKTCKDEDSRNKAAATFALTLLKAHGSYTYEHCTRLVDLSMALAKEMGYNDPKLHQEIEQGIAFKDIGEASYFMTKQSPRQQQALMSYLSGNQLAQGSLLHDIGKIKVPPDILYKPGMLNPQEARVMQMHPVWGAEILSKIPPLAHAIPATRGHHERWDGKGYPDKLKGEQIPLSARIVALADTWDAMVSDRPYRKGLSLEVARNEIAKGAGTQFDPELANAFVRIIGQVWSRANQY
ncbi:MAG: HD-GYP domain-containing protein [Candidatus Xenobia bacterium]